MKFNKFSNLKQTRQKLLNCLKRTPRKCDESTTINVVDNVDYHKMPLDELADMFQTSLTRGQSQVNASQLLIRNGKNKIEHKEQNVLVKIVGYFFTGFCGLLWIAAVICSIYSFIMFFFGKRGTLKLSYLTQTGSWPFDFVSEHFYYIKK